MGVEGWTFGNLSVQVPFRHFLESKGDDVRLLVAVLRNSA